jgi:hypothetical protein
MGAIRWVLAVALTVGAHAALADGPLKLGPKTWAGYQEYLGKIGSTGKGAFAVAADGKGYGYSYCDAADGCKPTYQQAAIENCQENNQGYKCIVMAVGRTPQMEFEGPK